jgi:hypothetical protein
MQPILYFSVSPIIFVMQRKETVLTQVELSFVQTGENTRPDDKYSKTRSILYEQRITSFGY